MLIIYKKIRCFSLPKLPDYDYLCYNAAMAKKKFNLNIKVAYDAPVTLSFVIVCALIFLLNIILAKSGKALGLAKLLSSPTSQTGLLPFIVKQPVSYLRLLLYIFGSQAGGLASGVADGVFTGDASVLFTNLILIMLLGPAMEERYGSVIIGIMIFVSALFSGVLNACFCETSLVGALPLVSMMIFLNAFMSFSKKKFPLSFAAVMVFFVLLQIASGAGAVRIIICIAGGLCGSLFAFLTSPKMKAEKKASKSGGNGSGGGLLNRAEKIAYAEELDSQSPRFKKKVASTCGEDETTVVGTLKF